MLTVNRCELCLSLSLIPGLGPVSRRTRGNTQEVGISEYRILYYLIIPSHQSNNSSPQQLCQHRLHSTAGGCEMKDGWGEYCFSVNNLSIGLYFYVSDALISYYGKVQSKQLFVSLVTFFPYTCLLCRYILVIYCSVLKLYYCVKSLKLYFLRLEVRSSHLEFGPLCGRHTNCTSVPTDIPIYGDLVVTGAPRQF